MDLAPTSGTPGAPMVVVFLQQPDGRYRRAAQTVGQPTDCGTSVRGIDGVQIKRHSVLMTWSLRWHGCHDVATFQFRRAGERWPLIGVASGSTEAPYGVDENGQPLQGPTLEITIDHNRITGDALVTQRRDQRAPTVRRLELAWPPLHLDGFGDFGVPENKAFPALCGRG